MTPTPLPLEYQYLMSCNAAMKLLRANAALPRQDCRLLLNLLKYNRPVPPRLTSLYLLIFLTRTAALGHPHLPH